MRGITLGVGILLLILTAGAIITARRHPPPLEAASDAPPVNATENKSRAPVVVELFTSEGCSSCPPADVLLQELEQQQPLAGVAIIPLSLHVDYWNDLGWTDPFSDASFSTRQSDYSEAFGGNRVYTPQMVVDGRAEFVGSRAERARQAIAEAARQPKAVVTVTQKSAADDKNSLELTLKVEQIPTVSAGDMAEVWLAVTESGLVSQVGRGENSGRRLTHTAVTRSLQSLGPVKDGTFTAAPRLALNEKWQRDKLHAIAFVQERRTRHIIGAATIALN